MHLGCSNDKTGDPKQCMYAMMTFGIPTDHLPLPPSNRMEEWIEMRRKLESLQKPMLIPSPLDVLLGRGKVVQDHAGNIWFRMLLKRDFPEYERLIKFDKNDHAQRIVQEMRDSGARFLRKDTNGVWEELDDREARVKVSHGFRNLRAAVYKE